MAGFSSPSRAQSAGLPDGEVDKVQDEQPDADNENSAIVVTGTRIRGARIIGDTISLDREEIVEAGQIDLGEAIRTLPQNFSGGQNPGVGAGGGFGNENVNSASSPNLRGLGPDATLTLLNGHRLPYNSVSQGVDISAIPLAIVDRLEVVPDGASALYGSDAIGGVVNVILRRDFEGVVTSAQLGVSTDGGNFRQQADIVAGTTWNNGGLVVAYDFSNNSGIAASQRSFTAPLLPETLLYPKTKRHAVTFSAHQSLAPGIAASLDALYSYRDSTAIDGTTAQRIRREPDLEAYSIAPSLEFDLGPHWKANLAGVFGRDRTRFQTSFIPQTGPSRVSTGRYLHEITSIEIGAEGPIFTLPGGETRLAVGAGFRNNSLLYSLESALLNAAFDATQRARFAFAELYVPLVSDRNVVDGIEQLTLSAAIRYEDYKGLDRLSTPRIGVNYSPGAGLIFRASWARSFKAPTLFQQNIFSQAILVPAVAFGAGSGSDTVFLSGGGNPNLQPERARSWTAGVEFKPEAIQGLTISATWFDIRYDDRVVAPIAGSIAAAINNPGFASLIDFSPDPTALTKLIAGAQFGLENFTGRPFDPADVVVLFDNRNINVAAWKVEGLDAQIAWSGDLGRDRSIGFDINGGWLRSNQTITPDLPEVQLAGTAFNPPRYRARGAARYQAGGFIANAAVNYIGPLIDRRLAVVQRLSPSATVDLGLRYTIIRGDDRDPGLEVSLTMQNLFNHEPEIIGQTGPTAFPYDSTNYSPVGRFIAFGVRRQW
ncbi:MAG: TonB-dependent receptor [Allopontixanthobacter sediminis]